MSEKKIYEDFKNINPSNLSISELREIHEKIWEIIQEIEFDSEDDNDENKDIEYLRNIMKKVIEERVERQREEVGRSPE
tara:strand:+ start:119 stop:355 length:237 start_codon:yes stop_codon:yes gene_type:complete